MHMDLDTVETKAPREFLAVVLAGFGSSLAPLTSPHGEDAIPKALLPVGNRPMISYTLAWLEESGINDVLIICPISHKRAISHYIHSYPTSEAHSSMHIEFQTHDQPLELSSGTCNLLRQFTHRIDGDFILLSCDFLPPPTLNLSKLLNKFRIDSTTDGSILTGLWYEHKPPEKEKSVVDDAWPSPVEPVPLVYDEKTGTLLHVDMPDDFDKNSEEMELRMALLWRYHRTKLSANLLDSHVYVCKRVVLDFLALKPTLESFREEFVPWLCKVHYEKTKRERYLPNINLKLKPINGVILKHSSTHNGFYPYKGSKKLNVEDGIAKPSTEQSELRKADLEADSSDKTISSKTLQRSVSERTEPESVKSLPQLSALNGKYDVEPSLRCSILVHRLTDGYAARANNVWSYLELNRNILKDPPQPAEDLNLDLDPKSSISQDSIVGQSTKVGERSSIKRSVIGRHCVIGKNVKIVASVLLDHCTIEDGTKIEGSILGASTHVHAKGELVRCITQSGFEVEEGAVYKHEKLESSEWATEGQSVGDSESVRGSTRGTDRSRDSSPSRSSQA